jgi:hypothetical protein
LVEAVILFRLVLVLLVVMLVAKSFFILHNLVFGRDVRFIRLAIENRGCSYVANGCIEIDGVQCCLWPIDIIVVFRCGEYLHFIKILK